MSKPQGQDKLKPCPFCGGEAGTDFDFFGKSELTRYFVYCSTCGASSPISETTEKAIEAWSTRARIEALEEALREAVEVIYYADGMVGIIRDLADCPGKAEALAKRIKKASENKILTQLLTTKEDNNK